MQIGGETAFKNSYNIPNHDFGFLNRTFLKPII
jgi:hypothetical protein